MNRKACRCALPRVESLESRALLAGNVTAAVVAGDLVIRGDTLDNAIEVRPGTTAGTIRVIGILDISDVDTTVNGAPEVTLSGVTRDFKIDMLRGSDFAFLLGPSLAVPRDLKINTVQGNDNVLVVDTTVKRNVSINVGSGNDSVQIIRSTIVGVTSMLGEGGNDLLGAFESDFRRNVAADMGSGNDRVFAGNKALGQIGSRFRGTVGVKLGGGADIAKSNVSRFDKRVNFDGARGGDSFDAFDTMFLSALTVNGGPSSDSLDAGASSGGASNGNSFAASPSVISIEVLIS